MRAAVRGDLKSGLSKDLQVRPFGSPRLWLPPFSLLCSSEQPRWEGELRNCQELRGFWLPLGVRRDSASWTREEQRRWGRGGGRTREMTSERAVLGRRVKSPSNYKIFLGSSRDIS